MVLIHHLPPSLETLVIPYKSIAVQCSLDLGRSAMGALPQEALEGLLCRESLEVSPQGCLARHRMRRYSGIDTVSVQLALSDGAGQLLVW